MGGPEMAPHTPQTLGAPRRSRGTPRYSDRLLASAVSQKFHPTLRTQGIALEGPAKWAGGAVPVTNEVLDAGRAKPVGCIARAGERSEEHTSELQSRQYLVCRLLLEKKKKK